ncbi:uncharacterized protein LOC123515096 isoform X2 [Portunus trituberculatus]|nr:uncharacterized protein LOC123515096 isoform X2 [Portunus trituberculatus]XP_045129461.1 uncharacterized protein LOC123515096 isoform X2 [Portunus trituberculatus]
MEDFNTKELKHRHVKRKAVMDESTEELPSKVPQRKPRVCDNTLRELPCPGRFMKIDEIFEFVKNSKIVLPSIPLGEKNNVFFVTEDSNNALRREQNLPVAYDDGCVVLSNKGNNGTIFVHYNQGKFKYLRLKKNIFYGATYEQNKASWKPLKPQPKPESLFKMNRYYSVLKGNIKRRVTSVSGKCFEDRAIFEYVGVSSGNNTSEFTFKSVETKSQNKLQAKKDNPLISKELTEQDSSDSKEDVEQKTQRNIKEIPNTNKQIQRGVLSKVHGEDLVMLAMLDENPFVQVVISRKDKSPCVILYNDKQFSEMKRNLQFGSVLGIDCTYKFNDCFVTMTVYQNSRALHKETDEPLLYLGPVFLHSDQDFLTYMTFFSHIMGKLEDTELNFEVKLGEDVELSLFRALKQSFPASVQMINTHHLKDLVRKHLNTIDRLKSRSSIIEKLFGLKGILSSPNSSVFQNRMMEFQSYIREYPALRTYFAKLQLFLYPYICDPLQRGISQQLWLNDNNEVLDKLLHAFLKDKPIKMSDTVEKICTVIRLQMVKLEDVW